MILGFGYDCTNSTIKCTIEVHKIEINDYENNKNLKYSCFLFVLFL